MGDKEKGRNIKDKFIKKAGDIKAKFDYKKYAGSKFEKSVKDFLDFRIIDVYKKCVGDKDWSINNLQVKSKATNNTITVDIKPQNIDNNMPGKDALIKSVISKAKEAIKDNAKSGNDSLLNYDWTDPITTCLNEKSNGKITITIIAKKINRQ